MVQDRKIPYSVPPRGYTVPSLWIESEPIPKEERIIF